MASSTKNWVSSLDNSKDKAENKEEEAKEDE